MPRRHEPWIPTASVPASAFVPASASVRVRKGARERKRQRFRFCPFSWVGGEPLPAYARCVSAAGSEQPAERFRMALALYELGERMLRQKLRRQRPDASEAEIDALIADWLHRRPGAELGDGEGRPVPWPRRR